MGVVFPSDSDQDIPFEFERKFFVRELPPEVRQHGSSTVIVQAYVFAEAGYAIRVRVAFHGLEANTQWPQFDEATGYMGAYERAVLAKLLDELEHAKLTNGAAGSDGGDGDVSVRMACTIAVKSPPVSSERYELEVELDPDVAVQILRRSERLVLKTRYSIWYGEDGWEFDVFEGKNRGLIIAECERLGPVVDLDVPDFCATELTGDLRFTNDYLSKEPWSQWDSQYKAELAARGPYFLNLHS